MPLKRARSGGYVAVARIDVYGKPAIGVQWRSRPLTSTSPGEGASERSKRDDDPNPATCGSLNPLRADYEICDESS